MVARECQRCGELIEQERGRPRLMHPDCRRLDRLEYWKRRPSKRRSLEDQMRPVLADLVTALNDPRRRSAVVEFAEWARAQIRQELAGSLSTPARKALERHLAVVDLVAGTASRAAALRPE